MVTNFALDPDDNYQGPGEYLHYKGGEYQVLGIALQENTVPKPSESGQPGIFTLSTPSGSHTYRYDEHPMSQTFFVIYRPLSEGSLLVQIPHVEFWARELSDFNAKVECTTFRDDEGNEYEEEGSYLVRRFVKLPDIEQHDLVVSTARVKGRTYAHIVHIPTGLIVVAEVTSGLWATTNVMKELRHKIAYRNARI